MRRAVFVILLITVEPKSSIGVISLLVGLQLIYFVFLVAIRPYKEVNCNVTEITNELYFLVMLASLLKYNTAADWEGTPTPVYTLEFNIKLLFQKKNSLKPLSINVKAILMKI